MRPDPAITRVVVTGAAGFIGRNLMVRLREAGWQPVPVTRETPAAQAMEHLAAADAIFHLAGVNRADCEADFVEGNIDTATLVAQAATAGGRCPRIAVASSIRASEATTYGLSKLAGERVLLAAGHAARVALWRLPNVFGKWARPDYNSVVATFCDRLAYGLPCRVDDPAASLTLLHIDDLIDQWLAGLTADVAQVGQVFPRGTHAITVGALADTLNALARGRLAGEVDHVGSGLLRALYATYVTYLPESAVRYPLTCHSDARGLFAEVIRTPSSGQVSFFTARPGVTRGGHYHHAKVEKFVVVAGEARIMMRNLASGRVMTIETAGARPEVVETIPGWTHDITNIGSTDLVVMVWANEVFDPARPDTTALPV